MEKRTRKLSPPKMLVETTFGTALQTGVSINLLRKPILPPWKGLPIRDDKPRTMTIEGRVELTPKGVRKAAAFLRTAADRLEGLFPRRAKKQR